MKTTLMLEMSSVPYEGHMITDERLYYMIFFILFDLENFLEKMIIVLRLL